MKAKILVIHRALAPYRIEFFNELYARYDVDIYFEYKQPREQNFDQELWHERIKFPYKYLKEGPSWLPNWRKGIAKIYHKKEYDIVLLSEINLITATLIGLRGVNAKRTRIFTMCDDNITKAKELTATTFDKKKLLLAAPSIDGVILCDNRAEKIYRTHFPHGERFISFPILQDDQFLYRQYEKVQAKASELRNEYAQAYGEDARYLLFVGRLSEEKNLSFLLETFDNTFLAHPQTHLLIVGDGPEEEALKLQAEKLDTFEQIHFCGKKQGKSLYTYYALADAFILPSTQDAFGAVVNEALVFGLPTAISSTAGSASLYSPNSKDIALFPAQDKERMGEAMRQVLENAGEWSENRPSRMPFTFAERLEKFWSDFEELFPDYLKEGTL